MKLCIDCLKDGRCKAEVDKWRVCPEHRDFSVTRITNVAPSEHPSARNYDKLLNKVIDVNEQMFGMLMDAPSVGIINLMKPLILEIAQLQARLDDTRTTPVLEPKTHAKTAKEATELALYDELIMAVGKVFTGESRHQTALRYIREAEEQYKESDSMLNDGKRDC